MAETRIQAAVAEDSSQELTLDELENVVGSGDYTITMTDCGCVFEIYGVDSWTEAIMEAEDIHNAFQPNH